MAMEKVRTWIRGSLIGAGAYGMVNLALNKSNGQLFAVKSIECNERARGAVQAMENELAMLQSLNSERVVRCLGSDVTSEDGKMMKNMFMEHMAGGSLADLMTKFGGQFDEALIRNYTRDILEGVHYLHSRGIVHCDIKGKNVLAGSSGAKLADFGGAKRISESDSGSGFQIKGTPLWMAPEVANQKEQGSASDIWSLGCTVVEMATGKAPWSESQIGVDPMVALYHIGCHDAVPVLPSCLSKQGQDFVSKCLQRDPRVRWTAAELLQHPFITEDFTSMDSAAPRQNSPVSILQSPRSSSSTAGTNASSSIGNSVPILQCPDFSNRFPTAFNFSACKTPLQRQESTTSSASVSDFWADSPVTPQANEWIVVRSPKTPSSAPSPSSSPSTSTCPARKMLAPIFSSPIWGGWGGAAAGNGVSASASVAGAPPKEIFPMSVSQSKENRLLGSISSADDDRLKRIRTFSSASTAVLRAGSRSGSDFQMAEAHDGPELLVLSQPAISKIPSSMDLIMEQYHHSRNSCSSSSSISCRREGGDRDREGDGEVRLERQSLSRMLNDEDISDAVARRRRRARENVGGFGFSTEEAQPSAGAAAAAAAGIAIDCSASSSLRGCGNSESCDRSSSFSCYGEDSRERPVKLLRCASSPRALPSQQHSGMSFDSNTAVASLAQGVGNPPPFRARTGCSDSNEHQQSPYSPPHFSSSYDASARFLTWRSQRPRDQFTGVNNSICSDSSASVKSSSVVIVEAPGAASSARSDRSKHHHDSSRTDSFSIKKTPTPCGSYSYTAAYLGAQSLGGVVCFVLNLIRMFPFTLLG